jgi:hypothetical protein
MSRLRRLVVSDRWFFVSCRVLPRRRILSESEFACLARVIDERRKEHGFLLSAWVITRAASAVSRLPQADCRWIAYCYLPTNTLEYDAARNELQ